MTADLRALFAPRGVAVVGASRDGAKLGAVMARSLAGYAGGRVLVNARNPDPDAGVYASVAAARAATGLDVDLAVLCVPAHASAAALTEAAAAGVRAALVCAGGFGEAGDDGARHERALAGVVRRTGVRLLGPNTSGFFAPDRGPLATFVPGAAEVPAGGVAVVASSGGVNHALAFDLANAGVGVSLAVGIGSGIDVGPADVLAYLADDAATTAVGLHIETVDDGPALLSAVRQLTAAKPVAALVVGRSDVGEFARSHTGALATSWRTTRAALRQAGAVVVDDERDVVDALTALSYVRLPAAEEPGVGIVTAQAGPGLLLVDRLRADGLRVPELTRGTRARLGELLPPLTYQRNPVDTGRPDTGFPDVLRAVAADPGVDLLVGYALSEPDSVDLVAAAQDAGLPGGPAVLTVGGLRHDVEQTRAQLHKLGIPTLTSPTAAANAVRALVTDARARRAAAPAAPAERPRWTLPPAVDEAQAKALLAALGFRTPDGRACDTRAEAARALADLGGPVAVKLLDAEVLHKTEVGGVHLGIRTPADLDQALDALDAAGATRYLVESMAPPGVELVLGARRDPVFGPVVLLGLGGTTAEALADVAIRVAPLDEAEAARMPRELAGHALLNGWRGGPVLDEQELARLIAALGAALVTMPELDEIEVNPLRVTDRGLLALDAVITTRQEATMRVDTPAPTAEGTVPWPPEAVARYLAAGYWAGQPLGAHVLAQADATPDASALVDGEVRMTYRELVDRADGAALRLRELGLRPDDRMVVQLPNCWQFVVLTLACLRLGVIPVMALPAHREHEMTYLAEHAEAVAIAVPGVVKDFDHQAMAAQIAADSPTLRRVLVADDNVRADHVDLTALCEPAADPARARAELSAAAPDPASVAVFLLSGGTTGLPKLIARTHNDYAYNAQRSAEVSGLGPDSVYLGVLPLSHNFPLACPGVLGTLLTGGRIVVGRSPDPAKVFPLIAAEGVTCTSVVPAVAQRWLDFRAEDATHDIGSLRVLQVGGARLADELARRVEPVLGCTLQQVFGMAEGLLNYTRLDDPDEVVCHTQGRPMCDADEILVVDSLGEPVPPGEPGILLTRGPYTPRGYYRAPEQNARAFTPDGWYRTGDIVRLRPDGNLLVEGRDKDMINRGGEKISAEEIENFAYRLDAVSLAAAVAMPDPDLGERVCVYAVPHSGAAVTLDDLRGVMERAGVARFKWPERLVLVDELATTKVGKIDKKALRADIARRLEEDS